ncbi:MAG: tungstate ABC transporter ATP-binding protein WtpC [Bacillota bacterium]
MIKLKNIEKKLNDFSIKNIDLKIDKGNYFVILGPTGTGKSVLLELIAGLMKPDKGNIFYGNNNITNLAPEKRNVGMVYQSYMLFPHLNVKENINFGLKIRKMKNYEKRLDKIIEILDIKKLLKRDIKNLSGGEKQRVALARALIISPKILLLDEPLSALDPNTKQRLQKDLKRIHKELNTTTIHVTHDFNEALLLADKIAIMNNGKIMQIGKTKEIFNKPKTDFVAKFVGSKNIFKGEVFKQKNNYYIKRGKLKIEIPKTNKEKVNFSIRPENIIISNERSFSSARNVFKGKVLNINKKITAVELKIDIGIILTSYITYHSYEKLNIFKNKEIYAIFKATSVHIY